MTDLPPASTAKPRPVIGRGTCRAPHLSGDRGSRGHIIATIRPNARCIAGWTCIALGKIGSLLLLWAIVTGAERGFGDDAVGTDALFGLFGIAPLFAMTLGTVAIGLWILMENERT